MDNVSTSSIRDDSIFVSQRQGSKSPPGPLASALASVQVDFNSNDSSGRSDTVQNDGISGRERKISRDSSDLADILIGK